MKHKADLAWANLMKNNNNSWYLVNNYENIWKLWISLVQWSQTWSMLQVQCTSVNQRPLQDSGQRGCKVQTLPWYFNCCMDLKVKILSKGLGLSQKSDKIVWISLRGRHWRWNARSIKNKWRHDFIQWLRILAKTPVASLQHAFFNAVHLFQRSSKCRNDHIPCNILEG